MARLADLVGRACSTWKYDWRDRVVKALDDRVTARATRFADRVASWDPALRIARRAERRRDAARRDLFVDGWDSGVKLALDTMRGVEESRHRDRRDRGLDPVDSVTPEVEALVVLQRGKLEGWRS